MPMMLQTRLGYTSMWAGLSLAPIGIFPVFLSPLIGRFAQRIDMRVIVTMSFLVFSAAFYLRTLFQAQGIPLPVSDRALPPAPCCCLWC